MGLTIGRRWPASAPRGDHSAMCDYCGVTWRRSLLKRDDDGNLYCPQEGSGRAASTLDRLNAAGSAAYARSRLNPVSSKVDSDDGSSTPVQRTTLDGIYQ